MTAQIGDTFRYEEQEYSIVAISNSIPFHPKDYGMEPEAVCTACWDGYWCDYKISDNGIFLQNLYINSKDGNYPEINGVKGNNQYMGHHLYKNINLPIPYSGKIVVGKDFINKYYVHMGYQRAWGYETLLEFVYEDGKLTDIMDYSSVAAELREKSDDGVGGSLHGEGDKLNFIEDSFSLDLKDKAWWIT